MDPLNEAYTKLTIEDKGKIDPAVKEKAITDTRAFLVEVAIASVILLIISVI